MRLLRKEGDTLTIIYDPKGEPLEVGDALEIMEPEGRRGVIAQVVDVGPLDLPGILTHVIRMETIGMPVQVYAEEEFSGIEAKIMNISRAICKIRKEIRTTNGVKQVEDWSGYSPPRESIIRKLSGAEIAENIIGQITYKVVIGEDETGAETTISAYHLQGLNIIAGKKGTGKSHVAKSILLGLIDNKAQAVVFDINDEYSGLRFKPDGSKSDYFDKLICVSPGENMMFTLDYIGLDVFLKTLEIIGLKEASLFEVMRIWEALEEAGVPLTLDTIDEAADSIRTASVKWAVKRRLAIIKPYYRS